ncbi:MAG: hypothetical protein RIR09_1242 [Pseudomonadota bacterium]
MSEQIDWSKAPADATHHIAENNSTFECWLKPGYAVRVSRGSSDWVSNDYADKLIADCATERPTTPSWSGEGLPPAGVVCEAAIPHTGGPNNERSFIWIEGRVIAYHEIKGRQYAWFAEDDDGFYPPGVFEFRPIRTPEQIAADEREAAVKDMMSHIYACLPRECWDESEFACFTLYDAGYRKP